MQFERVQNIPLTSTPLEETETRVVFRRLSQQHDDPSSSPELGKWEFIDGKWMMVRWPVIHEPEIKIDIASSDTTNTNIFSDISQKVIPPPEEKIEIASCDTTIEISSDITPEVIPLPCEKVQKKHKKVRFFIPPPATAWNFGKRKCFTPSEPTKRTNDAVIQIQKMARGWLQQLRFRMALLKHKLETQDEKTAASIAQIESELTDRKIKHLEAMTAAAKAETAPEMATVLNNKCQIKLLREENKKLRSENEVLSQDIGKLGAENDALKLSIEQTEQGFRLLCEHMQTLKKEHNRLMKQMSRYEKYIAYAQDSLDRYQEHALSAHKMRVRYMKVVGSMVVKVEEGCIDEQLVDKVVTCCLSVQG